MPTDDASRVPPGTHALWIRPAGPDTRDALQQWVTRAVTAGHKVVLYAHAGGNDDSVVQQATMGTDTAAAVDSGQVELLTAERLRAATGGGRAAVRESHLALLNQAKHEGYPAVSLSSDGATWRSCAADEGELLGYEQDLDALSTEHPFDVLCRYDPRQESDQQLARLLRLHYRYVAGDGWSALERDDCVHLAGELDAAGAPRMATVLHTAIDDGTTTLDMSAVDYLAVAAVDVLFTIAADLGRRGRKLRIRNPSHRTTRVLHHFRIERHPSITLMGKDAAP